MIYLEVGLSLAPAAWYRIRRIIHTTDLMQFTERHIGRSLRGLYKKSNIIHTKEKRLSVSGKSFGNYTLKTEQRGRGKKKALGKTEEKVFKL